MRGVLRAEGLGVGEIEAAEDAVLAVYHSLVEDEECAPSPACFCIVAGEPISSRRRRLGIEHEWQLMESENPTADLESGGQYINIRAV